jgi:hypothetical protein
MTTTPTVPTERRRRVILTPPSVAARAASERLTRALLNLAVGGQRPHCGDAETHHYWLSEKAHERALAVRWCHGCPVITECGAAATAQAERWGVWGAKDFSRRPRKSNPQVSARAQTSIHRSQSG